MINSDRIRSIFSFRYLAVYMSYQRDVQRNKVPQERFKRKNRTLEVIYTESFKY